MAIFSTRGENSNSCKIRHFPVSKQAAKLQFSPDMLENSYSFDMWGMQAIVSECAICNTSRRRVLQSHELTIACSPQVKYVIHPNKFSDMFVFMFVIFIDPRLNRWIN